MIHGWANGYKNVMIIREAAFMVENDTKGVRQVLGVGNLVREQRHCGIYYNTCQRRLVEL